MRRPDHRKGVDARRVIAPRCAHGVLVAILAGCPAAPAPQPTAAPPRAATAAPPVPVLFAPGVITSAPAFSPSADTVYFTSKGAIVASHRSGDGWTEPEVQPFSGRWADSDPAIAPDGSFLVFVSNRPATEPGDALDGEWGFPERKVFKGHGGNLWRVDRQGDGWGPAWRLPAHINRSSSTFEPSIVADGSLYFMDAQLPGRFRTYRSQYKAGAFQAPEPLAFSDGTWSDWDATVAPDESFLVLASDRPPVTAEHGDDLFIVVRTTGAWGPVTHLGPTINDPRTGSVKPRLGPDHHTLYFSSDRATTDELARGTAPPPGFRIWQVDLAAVLASLMKPRP